MAIHVLPRRGLAARMGVALRGAALDRRLAAGADPADSAALARRAEQLTSERAVHALAARGALLRLAAALRASPPVDVRAAAIASLLLTDGAGPLYADHPRGTLRQAALRAVFLAEAG